MVFMLSPPVRREDMRAPRHPALPLLGRSRVAAAPQGYGQAERTLGSVVVRHDDVGRRSEPDDVGWSSGEGVTSAGVLQHSNVAHPEEMGTARWSASAIVPMTDASVGHT